MGQFTSLLLHLAFTLSGCKTRWHQKEYFISVVGFYGITETTERPSQMRINY